MKSQTLNENVIRIEGAFALVAMPKAPKKKRTCQKMRVSSSKTAFCHFSLTADSALSTVLRDEILFGGRFCEKLRF